MDAVSVNPPFAYIIQHDDVQFNKIIGENILLLKVTTH